MKAEGGFLINVVGPQEGEGALGFGKEGTVHTEGPGGDPAQSVSAPQVQGSLETTQGIRTFPTTL